MLKAILHVKMKSLNRALFYGMREKTVRYRRYRFGLLYEASLASYCWYDDWGCLCGTSDWSKIELVVVLLCDTNR